ncbi:MAG TPA: hypothetical protein VE860_02340 [Chthoniobacterales bacterium]|jgi:hypothetical protein|nr:hypothetical protein [Chthoniobacterales bacterium]
MVQFTRYAVARGHITRLRPLLLLIWLGSISAAGAQDHAQIQIKGATINVNLAPTPSKQLRDLVMNRLQTAAQAVAVYYEQYPVSQVTIDVTFDGEEGVHSGRAAGWDGAHIWVSIGNSTTAADFADDWITTHEMVHLAFPSVPRSHHWIEEGLATYVEPIARARAGELTPEKVWGDMFDSMEQGLPKAGDRGLDFTHTWGRTYWGGALFCLQADVAIRKETGNRRGLEDAMRGILKSGGNIEVEWPLERALQVADQAAGVGVLEDLYNKMRAAPVAPDLDQLWKDLGVSRQDGKIIFDDTAPLAAVRRAITAPVSRDAVPRTDLSIRPESE